LLPLELCGATAAVVSCAALIQASTQWSAQSDATAFEVEAVALRATINAPVIATTTTIAIHVGGRVGVTGRLCAPIL
jgi:hypothetical protein